MYPMCIEIYTPRKGTFTHMPACEKVTRYKTHS